MRSIIFCYLIKILNAILVRQSPKNQSFIKLQNYSFILFIFKNNHLHTFSFQVSKYLSIYCRQDYRIFDEEY